MTEATPGSRLTDLRSLTEHAAAAWPDKVGLVFPHRDLELTFGQIDVLANRYARVLADVGVTGGVRVAVLLRNGPEAAAVWLGAAKLGACVVPVNTRFTSTEVAYILDHSGAAVVAGEPGFRPVLDEAVAAIGAEPTIIDCHRLPIPARGEPDRARVPTGSVDEDTIINIQYTSGTTSQPKGCLLSHGYWARIAREMTRPDEDGRTDVRIGHDDRFLIAQPMHYMDPQWHLATALMSGATLVVLDGFHPSTFWDVVRAHDVSIFYCLGAMPTLLHKMAPTALDRSHSVRAVLCSAIPPNLHTALEERWGAPWYELYGMTETGVDIRTRAADHDAALGTGCIGHPAPDREARILDPNSRPLPSNQVGQLAVRGPHTMAGYFRDGHATARTVVDGWVHTGDLARQDDDGRIYFVGREKHLIRRAGENIAAAQVEAALEENPDIEEAACVAAPDALRGEEVFAVVRPRRGAVPAFGEWAAALDGRLAAFKIPRYWMVADRFPRTASERVERRTLIQKIVAGGAVYDRVASTVVPNPFTRDKGVL